VKILVAKSDIDPGVPLDKTNVGFKEWPIEALPEGAISKEEDYVERALKHRVGPGQPILASELGKKGDFGVEAQIPEGMQLVSFPVTATMTHSGLLKPGSYVDVSAAIESPLRGGGKKVEIKPVLQCIQVIAVGNQIAGTEASTDGTPKDAKVVSFLAFPRQGQLLQLAYKKSNGAIQLALRSKSDKSLSNSSDLTEQSMTALSQQLAGESEENNAAPASVPTPVTGRPKSSIKSLVKRQTSQAELEVGSQATQRMWKIEVYQGDTKEIQEIPWNEDPNPNATPTSANTHQNWVSPLMNFFSKRPRIETGSAAPNESNEPIEHRPSSFVRRLPEPASADDKNAQP
jgi:pilus assembly protein CpaB